MRGAELGVYSDAVEVRYKMNYVVTCYAVSRVFKREEEWGSQQG
jgi:hypothetical protein